jgi:hypothetical protein
VFEKWAWSFGKVCGFILYNWFDLMIIIVTFSKPHAYIISFVCEVAAAAVVVTSGSFYHSGLLTRPDRLYDESACTPPVTSGPNPALCCCVFSFRLVATPSTCYLTGFAARRNTSFAALSKVW